MRLHATVIDCTPDISPPFLYCSVGPSRPRPPVLRSLPSLPLSSSCLAMSSSSAVLSVDAVIRRRVLGRDGELSGVLTRWRAYQTAATSAPSSHSSQQQAAEAQQALLQSLASLGFSVSRQSLIQSALDVELSSCDRSASAARLHTNALRADMAQLKAALQHATAERQHRLQVDAVAAQCNALASRADTDALIGALQADIARLESEQSDMAAERDSRRRQFALLALALDNVSALWRSDSPQADSAQQMALG